IGRQLATQLLVAEAHAEALAADRRLQGPMGSSEQDWFVSIYPSPDNLRNYEKLVQDVQETASDLLEITARYFDTGLAGGRLKEGIDQLTTEYLTANGREHSRKNRLDIQHKRDRLLDALVNFVEKIAIIANLDILVR